MNASRSAKMGRDGVVFVQRVFIACCKSEVSLWRELTYGPLSRVARSGTEAGPLSSSDDHPHERRNRCLCSIWSLTTGSCRRPETKTHCRLRAMQHFLITTRDVFSPSFESTTAPVNLTQLDPEVAMHQRYVPTQTPSLKHMHDSNHYASALTPASPSCLSKAGRQRFRIFVAAVLAS